MRGHEIVRERLVEAGSGEVGVSIATLAELRYGAACSSHPENNHGAIGDFLSGIATVGVSPDGAKAFGDIKAELRKQGTLIEDMDIMIAATARTRELILVTNNERHFTRIPELRLENWTRPKDQ